LSSRSRRLSIVLSAAAAALLLAAGVALHHERERRHLEAVVASGRAALAARVPGTAQCTAAVDWLLPRLAQQRTSANEAAWRVAGDCAMLSGRWAEAVTAYQALADRAPREAGPQRDLSRALTRAGRHTEAVDAARRALGLAPQAWQAERGLALAAAGAGDLDTAVAALERARALSPAHEHPALERQLADLAARRGRPAPASGGTTGQPGR
jgi:tetratricopeptide (TPR) repeat protein